MSAIAAAFTDRPTDAAGQTRVPMSDAAGGGVAVAAGVHEWRRRAGRRALALGRVHARRRKPLVVLEAGHRHPDPTRGVRWNRRRRTRQHAPGASACVRHLARLEREFVARVASRARQRVARRRGCARRHCGGGVLAPEPRTFLCEPPVREEGRDPARKLSKRARPRSSYRRERDRHGRVLRLWGWGSPPAEKKSEARPPELLE